MRHLVPVLGLGAILLLSGCAADSKWSLFRHSQDTARLPPGRVPSATDLVNTLNSNARQIQSLQCSNLDLDVKQGYQEFGIRGKLVCQKPRNFRMRAEALGKTEADIGSNDQEFWYLIPRGDPYLIHCSYQDLANGVRIPFPFQPDWIMEALGMAEREVEPTPAYVVQPKGRTLELVQQTKNAQGQVVRKVTVFDQSTLRVTDHVLLDTSGNEICRAHIDEAKDIGGGVVLPRRIVFSYRAERLVLKMTLWQRADELSVNPQFTPQMARKMFTRSELSGVQSFDLARGPDSGNQISPAGGLQQR